MKVFDLTGSLLDYWVGRAEKLDVFLCQQQPEGGLADAVTILETGIGGETFAPSKNWAQGGPIIERERISVFPIPAEATTVESGQGGWRASGGIGQNLAAPGASVLEAAMRLRVAAVFGPVIEDGIAGNHAA